MRKFIFISPFVLFAIIYFSIIKELPDAIRIAPEHEAIYYENAEENLLIDLSFIRNTIGHSFMYMTLSMSIFFDLYIRQSSQKVLYWSAFVFPFVFGGVMELVQQYFFPPRSAEWIDFFADIFGITIGYLLIKYLAGKYGKKFMLQKQV
ncbi:MAG: VanZ family protein [Paludibacteraceae bacterium]|nr:VanZ family protein [Paludibacteraceae bacterium]